VSFSICAVLCKTGLNKGRATVIKFYAWWLILPDL